MGYFNPRSRKGSDAVIHTITRGLKKFQPTLPQGERRESATEQLFVFDISTHAPARGATQSPKITRSFNTISTHAPARGATKKGRRLYGRKIISTHAPARGATSSINLWFDRVRISTHAPARGATRDDNIFDRRILNFNPRSRKGSDHFQRQEK